MVTAKSRRARWLTPFRRSSSAEVSLTAVGGGANQGPRVGKKRKSILGTLNAGSNRNFKGMQIRTGALTTNRGKPRLSRNDALPGESSSRRQWLAIFVAAADA